MALTAHWLLAHWGAAVEEVALAQEAKKGARLASHLEVFDVYRAADHSFDPVGTHMQLGVPTSHHPRS
eukprot:CAMPEP_0174699122 /NCGR_PEP_ID=MMETSP1094-20130205/4505_1 /TAXON_ID=156173 /ORGANISM="Chrysochromulina brevifilum, Strain UTEX LB 985" /LENGTH=67 /DNA_ID=CAMNT_0015896399 /DNA_START=403 /DNA_END=603 /DNA_ORIENTATION=-